MYEYRCDERLKTKAEGYTRLAYTGLCGGLEHIKDRDDVGHRGTLKDSRYFYHNRTNSILQQVKRKFRKMQMHCSEFHE
jgi:hypothetical protein